MGRYAKVGLDGLLALAAIAGCCNVVHSCRSYDALQFPEPPPSEKSMDLEFCTNRPLTPINRFYFPDSTPLTSVLLISSRCPSPYRPPQPLSGGFLKDLSSSFSEVGAPPQHGLPVLCRSSRRRHKQPSKSVPQYRHFNSPFHAFLMGF